MPNWASIGLYIALAVSTIVFILLIVNRKKLSFNKIPKYKLKDSVIPGSHKRFVREKLMPMSTDARRNTYLLKKASVKQTKVDLVYIKEEFKTIKTRMKVHRRERFRFKVGVVLKKQNPGFVANKRKEITRRAREDRQMLDATRQRKRVTKYQKLMDKGVLNEMRAFIKKNKNKPNPNDAD